MSILQDTMRFWSEDIESLVAATEIVLSRANYLQAAMNYGQAVGGSIMLGLALWRLRNESPRTYFEEAIAFGHKVIDCVRQSGSHDREYRFAMSRECEDLLHLEVLLDVPASSEIAWMCEPPVKVIAKPQDSETSAILDWLLLKVMRGGEFDANWDHMMKYVASRQKKQRCVFTTYTAYRRILLESRAGNGDAVREAVNVASEQFEKRKNDGYYTDGYVTSCGGQWNDAGIDFRLAAVIKAAHQQGGPPASSLDTIHQWRW